MSVFVRLVCHISARNVSYRCLLCITFAGFCSNQLQLAHIIGNREQQRAFAQQRQKLYIF